MAECQTHATLSKIYAFLLLPLPLSEPQVILSLVGMGGTSLQIKYQVRTIVLFLDCVFYQAKISTHYEKAVEGCTIDFMLSWPVLIKETMAQTLYADMG